jgi:hypothetical protein
VALALGDLRLEADDEPPVEVIDAFRDHKEAVVTELRRAAGKWRQIFERHVATIMRARNVSRLEAERAAYEIVLIEQLNAIHPDTDPNRCAHCGKPETPAATLLPIGWGARHAWLHDGCWEPWREKRRAEAIAQLAAMGIIPPRGNPDSNAIEKAKEAL